MILDFVLSLDGVQRTQTNWQRSSGGTAYDARCARLGYARECWTTSVGVKGRDLVEARDALINSMRQLSGGLKKESVLCIFGSSHGASVALAIAAALQNEMSINYICLADLPLFASGCNPPIPGVGNLQTSVPLRITRATSLINSRTIFAEGDRPRVTLRPDISAKVKENYFQHGGNAIKFSSTTGQWFWGSDMPRQLPFDTQLHMFGPNEVHGVITGWNSNQEIVVVRPTHGVDELIKHTFGSIAEQCHKLLDDHVIRDIWPKRWPVELAKF